MTQTANKTEEKGATDVEVHVQSLKTNARAHFKISETATVQQVWDEAVGSNHLDEQRTPGDTFRSADGRDLMDRLGNTLEQLKAEGICPNRHFEIRGPSGGAR